jgi:hypothetical protein
MPFDEHRSRGRPALHLFHPSTDHWQCNRVPNRIAVKTGLEKEISVTESQKVSEFCELNEGAYPMVFLVMLSCLIFKCNAGGGIPSFAAAPFSPVTLPLLDEVVHRCGDLLNPTHLFSGQIVDISLVSEYLMHERNRDRAFPHCRPWVTAVRDFTSCLRLADDQSALTRIISCNVLHER